MAAQLGRDAVVSIDGTPVAGVQTNGFNVALGVPTITSKTSDGFETYLDKFGKKAVAMTLTGVWDDDARRMQALAATDPLIPNVRLDFADGAFMTGTFAMTGYSEGDDLEGAVSFTCNLASSGAFVYTAAA